MRGESVVSGPSSGGLSEDDVILSGAARTSVDVLVFGVLASTARGRQGVDVFSKLLLLLR